MCNSNTIPLSFKNGANNGPKKNKGPEMIQSSNVLYLLVVLLINIKVSFATSKHTIHTYR